MSTSIKIIKFTGILSMIFLFFTYLVTVNIEKHIIELNTIWISNNFVLTILGGAFASFLVVLLCEIQKYFIDKNNTETFMFFQALYLYQALFLMQQNIIDYQSHPNIQIPENLLDNTTHMIKSQVYCLRGIDYTTIKKDNEIAKKHRAFVVETFSKIIQLEMGMNTLRCIVLEEKCFILEKKLANNEYENYRASIVTSSNEKVAVFLAKQLRETSALLEEMSLYLKTIDDNCDNRYNWNAFCEGTKNNYVSLFNDKKE